MKRIDLSNIKDVPTSCKDMKVYASKILPPKGYCAITLFGIVLVRGSVESVINHLNSDQGKITLNHERIHLLQGKSLGWLRFYIYYLYFYLILTHKGFDSQTAYYNIPFEHEAYLNQNNFNYNETYWSDKHMIHEAIS